MSSKSLLIAQGWLLQPSHLLMVDTRTKSAGTPTFLFPDKEKAAHAAFSFLLLVETNVPVLVPQLALSKYLVSQEKPRLIVYPITEHCPTERRLCTNDSYRSSNPFKIRTTQRGCVVNLQFTDHRSAETEIY